MTARVAVSMTGILEVASVGGEVGVRRASRWVCVTSEEGHNNPQGRTTAAHFAPVESRKRIFVQTDERSLSLSLSPLGRALLSCSFHRSHLLFLPFQEENRTFNYISLAPKNIQIALSYIKVRFSVTQRKVIASLLQ